MAASDLVTTGRETGIATADLRACMERILVLPVDEIPAADGPFAPDQPIELYEGLHLSEQRIVASYPGYAPGDPVPEELKQQRYERFMELAAGISAEKLSAKVGQRMRVLVDRVDEQGAIARSAADAPEIDGTVRIPEPGDLEPGDWAEVEITAADDYDLTGAIRHDH
jgi:hypothetical protein